MAGMRDAGVELSPGAAARLIERQFPALAPVQLEALGAGADNFAFLVRGRLVFRFPRRRIAAGLMERETRIYVRHLLVDEARRLCGVIDWGDVHLGDPALDLSIAFSFLPPGARGAFREAYGPIDAATWDRARFRALFYGTGLVDYGADVGDEAVRAAGEYALQAAGA
jgi:phosphotransferase family enzyme